jgi:predicted nuclease with RNAse H fold
LVGIAKVLGEVSLGVKIYEQHPRSALGQEAAYVGHQAGLEDPALAVDYRDDAAEGTAGYPASGGGAPLLAKRASLRPGA